jgi:hypothetical protein
MKLRALFGILAHDARVVGVGHVLGEGVFDLARGLRGLGGDVDAADPLLFHGHRVDARDLERRLRRGAARQDELAQAQSARAEKERPARRTKKLACHVVVSPC